MKITEVMTNILGPGGLASSNRYQIAFQFNDNSKLARAVGIDGVVQTPSIYNNGAINTKAAKLSYLADEVNIPGFSVSTGDFEGHLPGMNQKFAHTKTYRDFTITFLMDHRHLPYDMLHKWAEFIFIPQSTNGVSVGLSGGARNNYVLTNYYNDYTCNMVIDKLERTEPGDGYYTEEKTSGARSSLYLYNVFPYLINDITVSNGPNQPLKFQASFYFEYSEAVTRD